MCGIFGVIDFKNKIDKNRIIFARDILAHRGPDDAGIYFSPSHPELVSESPYVALAHRRLSIIDLSPSAHQPMSTPDGRYTIVFNGEIYNFREIREQKLESGNQKSNLYSLISGSDTEVILNLYVQYGKECLNLLRGMFAFAIWDDKEKSLFAARDRFGIKPFYYLYNEKEFIFSSELKAIKHYKGNLEINYNALDAFLRTGSVPEPFTIYEEVKALLPGHYLEMRDQKLEISKYWEFGDLFKESSDYRTQSSINAIEMDSRFHGNDRANVSQSLSGFQQQDDFSNEVDSRFHGNDRKNVISTNEVKRNLKYDDDAKKIIRAALLDTIKAHMVADVEVGAFLSGGIDSTAIVSLMRQVGKEKIKTVSIVFPDTKFDESKYSRLVAKKYNTEHIEIPFYEKDLLEDFEKIIYFMDQPTIDGVNTYFVSKAAKQAGLKVVLSGLGGDELFGGYPSFSLIPKYQKIKNLPFARMFMKAAAPLLKKRLPAKAIEYMKNPDAQNAEYKLIRGLFTDEELSALGWNLLSKKSKVKSQKEIINEQITVDDIFLPDVIASEAKQSLSPLQQVSYLETCYYMRNQLLRDSDVFSMANSIELRVPFVDHKLYEAVLPWLDNAYDKNFPKKMLVETVGDIPAEIIHRPKMGFTFPFEEWIKNGKLKSEISESINKLNSQLNLNTLSLDFEKLHWSRLWALYILSLFK